MVRVGIAYVVGAWLLIQVADIFLEAIELPEYSMRLIFLLLAIGLPVVLFAAWAYEMTPEGIKREKDVDRTQSVTARTGKKLNAAIMAMLIMSIGYLLYDKFSG